MLASRFEAKYLVSPEKEGEIKEFISPFVELDRFAVGRPSPAYPISSLYLDSPDLVLYNMTGQGMKNRFKLRIRSYSDEPEALLFFEIKRKVDGVVLKRRAPLPRPIGMALMHGDCGGLESLSPERREDGWAFLDLVERVGALPAMHIRYEREAYDAVDGSPIRITFDRELDYQPPQGMECRVGGPGWCSSDVTQTILEIKFTDQFTDWIQQLVHIFQLRSCSVPKYVLCVDHWKKDHAENLI